MLSGDVTQNKKAGRRGKRRPARGDNDSVFSFVAPRLFVLHRPDGIADAGGGGIHDDAGDHRQGEDSVGHGNQAAQRYTVSMLSLTR